MNIIPAIDKHLAPRKIWGHRLLLSLGFVCNMVSEFFYKSASYKNLNLALHYRNLALDYEPKNYLYIFDKVEILIDLQRYILFDAINMVIFEN